MNQDSQQQDNDTELPVPPELEGKTLTVEEFSPIPKEVPEGIEKSRNNRLSRNNSESANYAKHVHSYIREYISTADRKASFIFTLSAALLVFLYQKGFIYSWFWSQGTLVLGGLLAIAITFLFISCVLSVIVVFPRLKGSKRGYIYWAAISEFPSSDNYSIEIQKLDNEGLANEIHKHSYELSKVCKEKYKYVSMAIGIGSIGAITMILFLIFK